MTIKAWGPLFAWLALAGAGINGLLADHPEPYNRGQPTITPHKDSRRSELAPTHTDNQNGKKGEQERSWVEGFFDKPIDTLLVVFNGLLVLFTGLLYRATSGLFKETAELRRIADEQRTDLSRSIIAAEKSAEAAKLSADALKATERGVLIEKISPGDMLEGAFWAGRFPNSSTKAASEIYLKVQIALKNYGKTPVTIFNIHGDMFISEKPPEIYSATWLIDIALSEYTIAPQAKTDIIDIAKKQEISWEISTQLVNRTVNIWLIGAVRFIDIFDEICLREFIWRYDRRTNVFKLHRCDENRSRQ